MNFSTNQKIAICFILILLLVNEPVESCTIGVAIGKACRDFRPLLWKNRDSDYQENEVAFFIGKVGDFIGIINKNDTTQVWAGINSVGFAIINAEALDLEGDSVDTEGYFMKRALSECASVPAFEALLQQTNKAPGRGTKANFGVIDALGNAAIFEVGNTTYQKFDAADPQVAPSGFIIRTNFSFTGTGEGYGTERYHRARSLFEAATEQNNLSYRFILRKSARDLVTPSINPYPLPLKYQYNNLPEGFIDTNNSINRFRTVCCTVFHGVVRNENPRLSTMWCILGEPIFGIAIPLWVHAGRPPLILSSDNGAQLNQRILKQKNRGYPLNEQPRLLATDVLVGQRFSIWPKYLREEETIFNETEKILQKWRRGKFSHEEMRNVEFEMANRAFRKIR